MNTITASELRELAKKRGDTCVSICMPTHAPASEVSQDSLRLKNLLRQAEVELMSRGIRRPVAAEMLEPARELIGDRGFWEKRSGGLAMFVGDGLFRQYWLPVPLTESVTVNRRFQLKQLLPLWNTPRGYFVLALSQNRPRLFAGDNYRLEEIAVEAMPKDIEAELNNVLVDRGSQCHSAQRATPGKQAAVFHGQGGQRDTAKEDLANYFRAIDAAILPVLRNRSWPLVLAGVQYLLPIYREVSAYPAISGVELAGNFDHVDGLHLHERIWPMMQAEFAAVRQSAAAKYRQLSGTGKASADVKEIVPAAVQGRVEMLFVDGNRQQWGGYDGSSGHVVVHSQAENDDDDLLDLAAVETLLNRGTVHSADCLDPPIPAIAAVFRY